MKLKAVLFLLSLVFAIPAFSTVNSVRNVIPDDEPKYGQDSIRCLTNLSLYREFFKQWKKSNYQSESVLDAIGPWRKVFLECPKASLNTFVDGAKIIGYKISTAKTPEIKNAYIDTLMMVYDTRMKYFGKEGYVNGRKGMDLFSYDPSRVEDVYGMLEKSTTLSGNNTEYAVVDLFFRLTIELFNSNLAEKSLILENYDIVSKIVDHHIDSATKYASRYENVKNHIESSFEPYATCEDLIPLYTVKLKADPKNVELLEKVTSMLDKKGCDDSPLYFDASIRLHDLAPSPESAFHIGKMMYNKQNYTEAIVYLNEGLGMKDVDLLETCYFALADCYKNIKDFPSAVKMANEVIKLNNNDGRPYILIGDMYAETAGKCGSNDLEKKAPFWAAVDKYLQAKKIDPELSDVVNQRISAYSKQFPTAEMIFFHDYTEGQSYTVNCWFSESTIIRAAK